MNMAVKEGSVLGICILAWITGVAGAATANCRSSKARPASQSKALGFMAFEGERCMGGWNWLLRQPSTASPIRPGRAMEKRRSVA